MRLFWSPKTLRLFTNPPSSPRPCHPISSMTHPLLITMYVICLIEGEDLHLLQGIRYLFPFVASFGLQHCQKSVNATRTMPKPPSSTFPNCTLPILHAAQIHPNQHQTPLFVLSSRQLSVPSLILRHSDFDSMYQKPTHYGWRSQHEQGRAAHGR